MWSSKLTQGDDCNIHETVIFMGPVTIGDRVTIHPNCVIGATPSSVDLVEEVWVIRSFYRTPEKAPHTIIEDDVTILNNTTIQSGSKIGKGTIIGPLCSIGHHADIGKSVRIHAGAGCAGHVKIGRRAVLDPMAYVGSNLTVCAGARVGICSAVVRDISKTGLHFGSPARSRAEQRLRGELMRKLIEENK